MIGSLFLNINEIRLEISWSIYLRVNLGKNGDDETDRQTDRQTDRFHHPVLLSWCVKKLHWGRHTARMEMREMYKEFW